MNKPNAQPKVLAESEKKSPNQLYRRAILSSLEELKDIHSRSNVDLIRGRVKTILEDTGHSFDGVLFARSMKSVAAAGDITLDARALAQLSPGYKQKRVNIVSRKMSSEPETTPSLPLLLQASSPLASRSSRSPNDFAGDLKEAPVRKPDRDKWKIMPKKLLDKTTIVNPMDTH